jgi:DNA primase
MEISEIKSRLSILRVLENYGLKVNRHNQIKCPFHEDDKPSMKIYTETNTFNCFGCGANGDVIEFIQKKENLSKHQALTKAKGLVGENQNIEPVKRVQRKGKTNNIEILEKIFTYFQNGLKSGIAKKPKEYLQSRNLNPELFELGYNSGQFHHRGKLNEQEQNACIEAGLLIPYSGSIPKAKGATYSPFAKDCIIFP